MPGSFLDHEPACTSRSTATPSFFIPPSPSASSALSQSYTSIPRPISSHSHTRKRPRLETQAKLESTPRPRYHQQNSSSSVPLDEPSPAPLVNSRYRIAGGLDTPTAEKLQEEEQYRYDYEVDLRPSRFTPRAHDRIDGYFPLTPSQPQSTNENISRHSLSKPGWGRTVWTYTGGFAGKVFNFCFSTAFRGFHAGGGKGYYIQVDTPVVTNDGHELGTHDNVFDAGYRGRSPIPGEFPEPNFIEDYMLRPESHQDDQTPTQINDTGGSSLRTNWVLVNTPDTEQSPARKKSKSTIAQSSSRPSSRASMVRPRLHAARSSHGASFASPRASVAGLTHSRPSSSDGPHQQSKRMKSSVASPRRSELSTPNSPEVAKFEKKIRRQNQRQDDSIRKLNQQMQDMIKEAQQALGSKVEVVDEIEDEGYAEGTEISSGSGWSSTN